VFLNVLTKKSVCNVIQSVQNFGLVAISSAIDMIETAGSSVGVDALLPHCMMWYPKR
jgi:hypothetical protein